MVFGNEIHVIVVDMLTWSPLGSTGMAVSGRQIFIGQVNSCIFSCTSENVGETVKKKETCMRSDTMPSM